MDNQKIAKELVKIARELVADLRLSPRDKKVINSFIDKRKDTSKKLDTDGKTLDGLWFGGRNIAYWNRDDKIEFTPLSSRAQQTVYRAVRKMAPKFDLMNP